MFLTLVLGVWLTPFPAVAADEVPALVRTLTRSGSSFKVRIHTINVLASTRDERVLAALADAALTDRHPYVRVHALRTLTGLPWATEHRPRLDQVARRALRDPRSAVRAQARRSLATLAARVESAPDRAPPGPVRVALGAVADRSRRASPALRAQLRGLLAAALSREGNVQVVEPTRPGPAAAVATDVAYVIDATLARLEWGGNPNEVEVRCVIELVVSRPPRGIVLMASGEATVVKPRLQVRASIRPRMEAEALEQAVLAAQENLSGVFVGRSR